ncbi:hypothetical protein [Actinomadura sp. 3N407]|uniref:hypothetical protein n=1 Tax=Actinomadura sp. 3N407 TaxID=3457423 RepID=UPI003FCD6BF4
MTVSRTEEQQALVELFRYHCCWCPHTETDVDTIAAAERMNDHYETTHTLHLAAVTGGRSS